MKVAIIHDWLVTYAGAEKVLEEILNVFPEADVFSIVDFIEEDKRQFLKNKTVNTSFIQKLPFSKKKYRNYLPIMPHAVEQLDVSHYDVIISSSHAVAKGVITGPDQLHISYVHSPIRYAWDLQHQYLRETGLDKGFKGFLTRLILHKIRNWDYRTSNGVDYFLSNSNFISRRIWKVYRRDATTIYPPVDVSSFSLHQKKKEFYLTASRMVPYKKMDVIAKAFSQMPEKELVVIGDGPDFQKIKSNSNVNVRLLGYQDSETLVEYMQNAKAFVFAAEEDFGITPVEAQACGTPIIAYGKGGSKETVRGYGEAESPTGVFFNEQTPESIIEAIKHFEDVKENILPNYCRKNAERFDPENFKKELREFVEEKYINNQKVRV
ncbi:glycosyltransferase family 4 protein [Halobacillus sp. BBL2006]|uniref:glycosyltransferase family 4 protein n=1 Tax=Halobacillus sp. BBL2006 TaxID=1543706 RepID=UPI00054303AB|nr:glycosyltransferase family 4 protein [Halobacillus sp. BBL2006]KHE67414.1 glycosyl transferase family 1 [Halobacillus sp. BBL2006]